MPPPRVSEPSPEKNVDLEQALAQMLTSHTAFMNETKANMQHQATQLNNQATQLRNLEVQIGQMANLLTERQPGSLPSNSEVNPRRERNEHVKAVTLRSSRELAIQGLPPVIGEVETEEVSHTSQNDNTEREQPQEKKFGGEETEARDHQPIAPIPYPQRLKTQVVSLSPTPSGPPSLRELCVTWELVSISCPYPYLEAWD